MKVLVVSDSHGRHDLLRKAIGQEAPIDMLIHAGDIEGDLDKILGPKREYEVHAVAGNMDWGDSLEAADLFDMGGHKVFLTHGHRHGVSYTLANLREAAEDCGADVVDAAVRQAFGAVGDCVNDLVGARNVVHFVSPFDMPSMLRGGRLPRSVPVIPAM